MSREPGGTLDYQMAGLLVLALAAGASAFVVAGAQEVASGDMVAGGIAYLGGLILIVTVIRLVAGWAKAYSRLTNNSEAEEA